LLDLSKIEITIQVPENLITLVPQVTSVLCRFDAVPDREFVGRVTKVGSEASQTTRTYPVTVEIERPDDVDILPGMAAMVRNNPDEAKATDGDGQASTDAATASLVIPASALVAGADRDQSLVWVVDEAAMKVSKQVVRTDELTPFGITVNEGLQAGQWVVTAGVNSLREGQDVRILEDGSQ
jgi:RND family efflux transporter MFP subunit